MRLLVKQKISRTNLTNLSMVLSSQLKNSFRNLLLLAMQAINPKKPSHPRRVKRSNNKIIKKLNMITGQIRIIRVITMNKVTMCGTTI